MKYKWAGWVVGGLITFSVLGATVGIASITKAAETDKSACNAVNIEKMHSDHMSGAMDMMNASEMQTKCEDMMANPEMQENMKKMLQQPQMQSMMRQMIANDPEFRHMMSELINNTSDINQPDEQNSHQGMPEQHSAHHMAQ